MRRPLFLLKTELYFLPLLRIGGNRGQFSRMFLYFLRLLFVLLLFVLMFYSIISARSILYFPTITSARSAERRHFVDNAAIEARNAYRRKWYRENKEKVRKQQMRYWTRKAAQLTAKDAAQEDAQKGKAKHEQTRIY